MSRLCGLTSGEGQVHYSSRYAARARRGGQPHPPDPFRRPVGRWCEIGTMTTMAMNVRLTEEAERVLTALSEQDGVCLLYTSDAADDLLCVDLGGRRII